MARRLSIAAWVLLIATALTGVVILLMGYYGPGYFTWIRLHRVVGWAMCVVGPAALAWHLWNTGSKAFWPTAGLLVGGLLAIPIPYAMDMPEEEHDSGPFLYLLHTLQDLGRGELENFWPLFAGFSLVGMLAGSVLVMLIGLVSRTRERDASRRTGIALTMLAAWATVGGVLLDFEPVHTRVPAQMFHSFAGAWTAALLLLHLGAQRAARSRLPRPVVVVAGLLAVLVFFGALAWRYRLAKLMDAFTWIETPATAEARDAVAARDPARPFVAGAAVQGFRVCGAEGCHPQVTAEWAGSAHRFSASNAFYRAAVDDLLLRGFRNEVVLCANCHDPGRVFDGSLAEAYEGGVPEGGSDGVGCVACHSIRGVATKPPQNGLYTVGIEPPYPGADDEELLANLRIDSRRHRDVFVFNDLIYRSKPCKVCHRVALGEGEHAIILQDADLPDEEADGHENNCRDCHLTPLGPVVYTHRMPGINVDLAAYAPVKDEQDRVWMAAQADEIRTFAGLADYVPIGDARWLGGGPPSAAEGTAIAIELQTEHADGEAAAARALRLHVTTRNERVGHSFPIGPFDLNQIWLELRVTDARGRVLRHDGALAPDGAIEGEPLRLGGRELNAEGEEIPKHRILEIARVADKRKIPRQGEITDTVDLAVPEDAAWPVEVRARWLFRRANPEFTRWALDDERALLPTWELARAQARVGAPPD